MESSSDKNFLDSVYEFIEREKKYLLCTEADEQRYIIYSAAFDMVPTKAEWAELDLNEVTT